MGLRTILRQLMKEKKMTYKALAQLASVPESSLKDWSNGVVPRDMVAVKRVSEILGVSFEYLILGSDGPGNSDVGMVLKSIPTKIIHSGWVKLSIEVPDSEISDTGVLNKKYKKRRS